MMMNDDEFELQADTALSAKEIPPHYVWVLIMQ